MDPRREPHAAGALHRRLPRRGRRLRLVHDLAPQVAARATSTHSRSCTGSAGEHDLTERELAAPARAGADSAPVRVGNGAWGQTQLDVYGELLDALAPLPRAARRASPGDPAVRRPSSPTRPPARWEQKDAGMWEMRGEPRHHLSSKVLCWTALDRAVKLGAAARRVRRSPSEWAARARPDPRRRSSTRGWSESEAGLCAVVRHRRARRGARS